MKRIRVTGQLKTFMKDFLRIHKTLTQRTVEAELALNRSRTDLACLQENIRRLIEKSVGLQASRLVIEGDELYLVPKEEVMEDQNQDQKVTLNEREMTKEEFDQEKADLESKPGVSVREVGQGKFRSRIQG